MVVELDKDLSDGGIFTVVFFNIFRYFKEFNKTFLAINFTFKI